MLVVTFFLCEKRLVILSAKAIRDSNRLDGKISEQQLLDVLFVVLLYFRIYLPLFQSLILFIEILLCRFRNT